MTDKTWDDYVAYVNACIADGIDFNAIWKLGPPPSIGWWPASTFLEESVLRFWNGKCWSWPVDETCSLIEVATMAERPSNHPHIFWAQRPWWWNGHGDA